MTNGETHCATCGALIAQEPGGLWYHTGGQVPHPATPRTEAAGVWQEAQRRLREAEVHLSALGPLVEAALAYQHANDALALDVIARNRALLRAARAYREAAPRPAVDGTDEGAR